MENLSSWIKFSLSDLECTLFPAIDGWATSETGNKSLTCPGLWSGNAVIHLVPNSQTVVMINIQSMSLKQKCTEMFTSFKAKDDCVERRLEHASRSCSTWVAVGDITSTSQLPSPHGGHTTSTTPAPPPPAITAADLIRSVNKKVTTLEVVWFSLNRIV